MYFNYSILQQSLKSLGKKICSSENVDIFNFYSWVINPIGPRYVVEKKMVSCKTRVYILMIFLLLLNCPNEGLVLPPYLLTKSNDSILFFSWLA